MGGEKERNGGRKGSPYRADEVPGRGIVDEDVAPLNSESEKSVRERERERERERKGPSGVGTHPHSAHKSDTSFFFFLRGGLPAPAPEANMLLVSRPTTRRLVPLPTSAREIDPRIGNRQPRSIHRVRHRGVGGVPEEGGAR